MDQTGSKVIRSRQNRLSIKRFEKQMSKLGKAGSRLQLHLLTFGVITLTFFLPQSGNSQIACLPIQEVKINDVSLFSEGQIDLWVSDFEGNCLGLEDFNAIMERVTTAYIDEGYITSRAYLPEQDLADGDLEITVVEGRIEQVLFNDKENPLWQKITMPGIEGRVANIREVEQGLDVISLMPSYQPKMEFLPGEEIGESILSIEAVSAKPWRVNFSTNNFGQEPLARYNTTIGFEYDNALGLNEVLSASFTKGVNPTPLSFRYNGPGSESYSLSGKFPYGRWLGTIGFNRSTYDQEIDGVFTPIPVDGWSKSYSLSARYLYNRDQTSKTYINASLERKENKSFVADTLIESSSRVITSASIGISDERPILGGYLQSNASFDLGLPFFGAENHKDMPKLQPDAQYKLAKGSLTFSKNWERGDMGTISWNSTNIAQLSFDRLYSSQQFSLGGPSTVRGIMSQIASGSSGILTRNEFEWTPKIDMYPEAGRLSLYTGFDYGHIFGQGQIDVDPFNATGVFFGIRLKGGWFDVDASIADLVCFACKGFDKAYDDGVFMLSISKSF